MAFSKAGRSSAISATGPAPSTPKSRARPERSGGGSLIAWPIHLFSTGRPRSFAVRSCAWTSLP